MKVKFREWECDLNFSHYENGRVAIRLIDANDGEPVATATTNVPEEDLGPNEVFIKDYSENAGMLAALQAAGAVEPTGRSVDTGFVSIPVCRLLVASFASA